MSKFIEVEVTRVEGTTVYLEVPDDTDLKQGISPELGERIKKAAIQTTDRNDWDNYGWEQTIEWQGAKVVTEKTAAAYEYLKLDNTVFTPEVLRRNP